MRQEQLERQIEQAERQLAGRPRGSAEGRRRWPPLASTSALAGLRLLSCCWACAALTAAAAAAPDNPPRATQGGASETPVSSPARRAARTPLPPRRPQTPAAPPPTSGAPPAPETMPELPPLDTSVPPPTLPRASRERMRVCATQWQKIKQEGQAGATTWREFAARCLTR